MTMLIKKYFSFFVPLLPVAFISFFVSACTMSTYQRYEPPPPLPDCAPLHHPIRLALVLGGGGSRGMAHVGVLKEFEEANLPVDVIVGCSAGALVGGLYAEHPQADALREILSSKKKKDFVDFDICKARFGLAQGQALRSFLKCHLDQVCFEELKIPLVVVATDLSSGELICMGGGPVVPAIHASCALPFYFTPVRWWGRTLVDGGVVDAIPVKCAKERNAEVIVAVDLTSPLRLEAPNHLFGVAKRCAEIKLISHNQLCLKEADVVITPDLYDIDIFEDQKTMQIYEAGREAARQAIPLIKKKLAEKGYCPFPGCTPSSV